MARPRHRRSYFKQYRRDRLDGNQCERCGAAKDADRSMCAKHLQLHAEKEARRRARYLAARRCKDCGAVVGRRKRCDTCCKRAVALRWRRLASMLCTCCGQTRESVELSLCEACRLMFRVYGREARARGYRWRGKPVTLPEWRWGHITTG